MRIDFTKEKYRLLRKAYNKAVSQEQDSFTFEQEEYLTKYAKYLLEYLKEAYE